MAAVIGGSGTFSFDFPGGIKRKDVEILDDNLIFSTPFGTAPPMVLFRFANGRRVLCCRMHGWRPGVSRRAASQQIFWVFREAGVSAVLAEGGVGTVHLSSRPGDFIIPDDYIDWSCRRDTSLGDNYLLIMRDPLCPEIRALLHRHALRQVPGGARVLDGGVYAVTDGRHFESRAEVKALASLGVDIIGQSLAPEVYLSREIGACYAGIHQVVNRAEGIGKDWSHDELKELFLHRAGTVAGIMLDTALSLSEERKCGCSSLRKETLLKFPDHANPP
ncbi:MTAP family purine nucleoside phosphorylase [Candidatus Moduliflexota bacterium]